jgi:lipopolysaccharide/colanic/teichoic acid biosynthesis glycosyltransferase
MNRLLEVFIALTGMVLLLPVFIFIAILIFLQDRGRIFFTQVRIGKDGKDFRLYKFRSMREVAVGDQPSFEPGNTFRVTAIGRFLRKTKLDELPQLYNVIKGDMSLVGPRPEVRKWVEVYPTRWEKVLSVRPGITDTASLVFRNEEDILASSQTPEETYKDIILPRKLDLYEIYVENRSLAVDMKILTKTIGTLIGLKPNPE